MLTATILTSTITALTILIHYEAIGFVHRWQGSTWGGVRGKVVSGVFFLFAAHSLEIWLFAAGIYVDKDILLLGGSKAPSPARGQIISIFRWLHTLPSAKATSDRPGSSERCAISKP